MRRIVAVGLALGLLPSVLVVVGQALLGKPCGDVLNDGSPGDHAQHLRPAAEADEGYVVVQTVGHGQEVRHVAGSVVVYFGLDAMPVLRGGQQRGRDVLAASEDDAVHAAQHLGSVRAVIAPRAYQCAAGLRQIANAIGIEAGRSHGVATVVKIAGLHLRQHRHRDARLAEGLHDVRAELIVGVGPPGDGDAHFLPAAVRWGVVATAPDVDTYATEDGEDGGERPK